MKLTLGKKRIDIMGWARSVTLEDGRAYRIYVKRGKRVRIPYKPRGQNIGYHWWADVYEQGGRSVAYLQVSKSLGVRGILREAGLIEQGDDNAEPA